MQLSSGTQIPDGLLAAIALRNEKPRLGVPSWNPALHQGINASNSTIVLGLQSTAALNRIGSRSTGKERDTESGLDYFGARYYSSNMGRFSSPDPSGLYYANPANPQSLNLYSYVLNNPLVNTDPSGMECVWDDGSFDSADDKDTGSGEKCGAQGGTWIDPDLFENGLLTNGQNANYQRGDWSGSANSVLQASWVTPAATVGASPDNSVTLDVPMSVWNWAALQTTKPSGVWTYGNWAGPGGSGAPIDNLDAGAMMHDYCYHQGGFSAMSNYGGHSDALQACNQALCDTAAKAEAAALAPIESAAAKNQGPNDPGGHLMNEANAAADVVSYFSKVPFGNSCKVHP